MSDTDTLAVYPCLDCGKMRTKDEGGTTFTVCDECWEKVYGRRTEGER
jgi:DNA-directed RNA polymerase subunit RPC12/RpoP